VEGHSSRLEQVEDRISELEDKIEIKEVLVRQLKNCKKNMKELSNSIKRPNLGIMGTEEGDKVQSKGIHNIFNKIIKKISQIFRKFCSSKYRKPQGH
jgi:hypothetical protein